MTSSFSQPWNKSWPYRGFCLRNDLIKLHVCTQECITYRTASSDFKLPISRCRLNKWSQCLFYRPYWSRTIERLSPWPNRRIGNARLLVQPAQVHQFLTQNDVPGFPTWIMLTSRRKLEIPYKIRTSNLRSEISWRRPFNSILIAWRQSLLNRKSVLLPSRKICWKQHKRKMRLKMNWNNYCNIPAETHWGLVTPHGKNQSDYQDKVPEKIPTHWCCS